MQTHDEETRAFFKNSSVQVLLCPRSIARTSWAKKVRFNNRSLNIFLVYNATSVFSRYLTQLDFGLQDAETIYSHHQKTVIVDADAGIKRRIMAFVGGLDLCKGRYDTPEHSLFSTLNTLHKDDYHNPNYTVNIQLQSLILIFLKCDRFLITLYCFIFLIRGLQLVVQENHGTICIVELKVPQHMMYSKTSKNDG